MANAPNLEFMAAWRNRRRGAGLANPATAARLVYWVSLLLLGLVGFQRLGHLSDSISAVAMLLLCMVPGLWASFVVAPCSAQLILSGGLSELAMTPLESEDIFHCVFTPHVRAIALSYFALGVTVFVFVAGSGMTDKAWLPGSMLILAVGAWFSLCAAPMAFRIGLDASTTMHAQLRSAFLLVATPWGMLILRTMTARLARLPVLVSIFFTLALFAWQLIKVSIAVSLHKRMAKYLCEYAN